MCCNVSIVPPEENYGWESTVKVNTVNQKQVEDRQSQMEGHIKMEIWDSGTLFRLLADLVMGFVITTVDE